MLPLDSTGFGVVLPQNLPFKKKTFTRLNQTPDSLCLLHLAHLPFMGPHPLDF